MAATIQSLRFPAFFIQIKTEPVLKTDNYHAFALADSEEDIFITVKGVRVSSTKHVAIDSNSEVWLYSLEEQRRLGHIGQCLIEEK